MSAREWEPGDVVQHGGERGFIVIRSGAAPRIVWEGGGWTAAALLAPSPLAVIDPEDREDVERLSREYAAAGSLIDKFSEARTGALQAALREFANPPAPKPEEPTGLGAVVEDVDGNHFVRTAWLGDGGPWESSTGSARTYDSIDAVRVLSEGVTP